MVLSVCVGNFVPTNWENSVSPVQLVIKKRRKQKLVIFFACFLSLLSILI